MHPVLFHIRDFFVGTYGILIVVGLVAGLALMLRRARQLGLPTDFFYDLTFVVMVSGFIGARILFILINLKYIWGEEFGAGLMGLIFAREGFVFMGGFVGAIAASIWFIRRRNMPLWDTADIVAPSLAVGHAFGRIGCFLAGCCYGGVCEPGSFWSRFAVSFPRVLNDKGEPVLSFAWSDQVRRGLIEPSAVQSLPLIPTQLLESAVNFTICGLLLLLWRRRRFSGHIFLMYLFFYGTARFGLEYLRGDLVRGVYFGGRISTSQIFSLAAIAAGVIAWKFLGRDRPGPTPRPRRHQGKQPA